MAGIGDIFGKGSVAEQFLMWNVLSQLAQGLLAPVAQNIANETWSLDPTLPIDAATAAELVARGKLVQDQGSTIAGKSGIGADNFAHLVEGAKHAPPFEVLVEGVRRKLIGALGAGGDGASFAAGLADLGIHERWWDVMAELVVNKPTGQAALQALLQGQIDHDKAFRLWVQAGEDPEWFQDAFNSEGTAPTPDMAGTMANRGIIDWEGEGPAAISFRQAFLEGPWRNKWEPAMRRLMEYLPPARTVSAMVRAGSITDTLALQLWEKEGLKPELAAAYLADAHHTKAAADKELTKAEIAQLYKDGKITEVQAEQLITKLGYSTANAALILSLANVQKADIHVTAAISRVRTLYVAHKINAAAAKKSLTDLKVSADQAAELMDLWDIEIGLNVKQLTPAQLTAAWDTKIITQAECVTELEHLGYTPFDAWVLMSLKNGTALPGKPAQGSGPGVNP